MPRVPFDEIVEKMISPIRPIHELSQGGFELELKIKRGNLTRLELDLKLNELKIEPTRAELRWF